jgi:hypothetical protein
MKSAHHVAISRKDFRLRVLKLICEKYMQDLAWRLQLLKPPTHSRGNFLRVKSRKTRVKYLRLESVPYYSQDVRVTD